MPPSIKKEIDELEWLERINKIYKSTKVVIDLHDMLQIMKAANRCVKFCVMSEIFTNEGMSVDIEEMVESYKKVAAYMKKVKSQAKSHAQKEVGKQYKLKQ